MRGTPCRAIALVPVSDVIPWEAAPRPPPHCLLTLSLCPAVGGGHKGEWVQWVAGLCALRLPPQCLGDARQRSGEFPSPDESAL